MTVQTITINKIPDVGTRVDIGFTGHRPPKLGGYDITLPAYKVMQADLETYIERNLEVYDIVVGHSGLALGGDTIWSKAILSMKEKHPTRVFFHAEIPMLEQPSSWFKESDTSFWSEQIEKADVQTIYGSLASLSKKERSRPAAKLMDDRNIGMLDHSDVLLALHDGSPGGMLSTRQKAMASLHPP